LSERTEADRIARLEDCVAADPGAAEFPALDEALRRTGRLGEAEEVARRGLERKPGCLEGTLMLAFSLLDQGDVEAARSVLLDRACELYAEGELPAAPARDGLPADAGASGFEGEVTDGELESAFDAAEPVLDELIDANRVAEVAMRVADLDEPEVDGGAAADPIFATQTMAELLERQGDSEGASRIRASLETWDEVDTAAPAAGPVESNERERAIATLESWLANLRSQAR
jgi:hypothetical protein